MKIYVDMDERYPDYYASEEKSWGDYEVEITEEEWKDYLHACVEYQRWQNRLRELVDALKRSTRYPTT